MSIFHRRQALRFGSLLVFLLVAGCGGGSQKVLGVEPAGEPRTVAEAKQLPKGTPVVLRGRMIEKWPTSGCWFSIQDKTGKITVDTEAAGWVSVEVPLQTEVTAAGVVSGEGSVRVIEGTGLRY